MTEEEYQRSVEETEKFIKEARKRLDSLKDLTSGEVFEMLNLENPFEEERKDDEN